MVSANFGTQEKPGARSHCLPVMPHSIYCSCPLPILPTCHLKPPHFVVPAPFSVVVVYWGSCSLVSCIFFNTWTLVYLGVGHGDTKHPLFPSELGRALLLQSMARSFSANAQPSHSITQPGGLRVHKDYPHPCSYPSGY